jgi:uncharacterized protein YcbX
MLPRVSALFRFPVKSMLGEQPAELRFDERGCVGDRIWSVRTDSGKLGSGKSTRRFEAVPGLLDLRAREHDGRLLVEFPDGGEHAVDAPETAGLLTAHVGRPVTLVREDQDTHFDDGPVSILGQGSVSAVGDAVGEPVDAARFRANIILDTVDPFLEERWLGNSVQIGTAVFRVVLLSNRCVMVNMTTRDLPAQPGNLAAIGRINDTRLGVIAVVETSGHVRVGDTAQPAASL